jgi:hypothetical protein
MKKFLIAGSSLAAVAAAGSAGAIDVTLGGSISMSVDYGLGKDSGNLTFGGATNAVTVKIGAAHTTDGGLAFGGNFTMGTAETLEFSPYVETGASGGQVHYLAQKTNKDRTDIVGHAYNVSGGAAVDLADIVNVKINSAWYGIDSDAVQNIVPLTSRSFTSSAICKIAGRGNVGDSTVYAGEATLLGAKGAFVSGAAGSYLPAGQMMHSTSDFVETDEKNDKASASAGSASAGFDHTLSTTKGALAALTKNVTLLASKLTIKPEAKSGESDYAYAFNGKGAVDFVPTADGDFSADVTSAAIYVGPFMEVQLASSSTKMVVGALCLDGNDTSATMIHMNNASDVVTVNNASIYIDGGFGRLTLQSTDYAGGVGAIAGAGDAANIEADGIVVVAQGLGILGANPYIAVDLAKGSQLGSLEVITGGTIDLGGLSAAIDVALDNPDDVFGISSWDLGASYAMGDLSLGFATDSSSDWGLSASMAIAGFGVNAVFGSSTAGDHAKSGITYSVSASTALNGFGLSMGFDQDLQPTVGVNYDLGGLTLSAGYDAGEGGGSLGATLSF